MHEEKQKQQQGGCVRAIVRACLGGVVDVCGICGLEKDNGEKDEVVEEATAVVAAAVVE